jgi:hypothetical protein
VGGRRDWGAVEPASGGRKEAAAPVACAALVRREKTGVFFLMDIRGNFLLTNLFEKQIFYCFIKIMKLVSNSPFYLKLSR